MLKLYDNRPDLNLDGYNVPIEVIRQNIKDMIPIDAVSIRAHDQVRWERDVAIAQLASYNISLGEKADVRKVVHAKWEEATDGTHFCSHCGFDAPYDYEGNEFMAFFCYHCGSIMDLEREETNV